MASHDEFIVVGIAVVISLTAILFGKYLFWLTKEDEE